MRTPKTVQINAKCADLCLVQILDEQDEVIAERDGYVPDFMPGDHGGDYVELEIDIATGKILNWKPKGLAKFIKENLI